MKSPVPSKFYRVTKRLLDIGILLYLVSCILIVATGGLYVSVAGIRIRAAHLDTPLLVLILLILLRLALSIRIKEFILLLGALLFAAGIVEATLRIWDPPIARPRLVQIHKASPLLDWELVPGASGTGRLGEWYRINHAGMRDDKDYPLDKKASGFRIAVVGDSFTFGSGVELEATFPKQMEKLLLLKKIPAEVLNFGVIGYNMWQYNVVLEKKALPYHPDLVVLCLFQDDLGASNPPYHDPSEWRGTNPFEEQESSGIIAHFALGNLLRKANALFEYQYRYRRGQSYVKDIEARKRWWGPANPTDMNYRIMSGKAGEKTYSAFERAFARFVKGATEAGAAVLTVMIPDAVQLHDPAMQTVNRIVERMCASLGVPFLDVTPMLEADGDPASLYLFPIDAHNSPKGLRIIAQAIVDQLFESKLVNPP
jgi:lysophospholipase L1-like esterase